MCTEETAAIEKQLLESCDVALCFLVTDGTLHPRMRLGTSAIGRVQGA